MHGNILAEIFKIICISNKISFTVNFEEYTQFHLVYQHDHLEPAQVRRLLARAYMRYYVRPSYWLQYLWWKIRGVWL